MATHSSILAWRIPGTGESGGLPVYGVAQSWTQLKRLSSSSSSSSGSVVKNPKPAYAGDAGSIPGLGRSPREGNGNRLQYSCLENPMDGGAWQATVHGEAKESDVTQQLNNKPTLQKMANKHSVYPDEIHKSICKLVLSSLRSSLNLIKPPDSIQQNIKGRTIC